MRTRSAGERCEVTTHFPSPHLSRGRIVSVCGSVLRAKVPGVAVGDTLEVERQALPPLRTEVLGFESGQAVLCGFSDCSGVYLGAVVRRICEEGLVIGEQLLGTTIDSLGLPYVQQQATWRDPDSRWYPLSRGRQVSLKRRKIAKRLPTGVTIIDHFAPLAMGQRIALFAEPGVGKSSLIAEISSKTSADVSVVALIGERGREIDDAIESLQNERTVLVVSPSSDPSACRARAAETAFLIAEHFASQGKEVLLQLDSLTRLCRAYREVGLASGEMPVRRGYPPSLFQKLPALLERGGQFEQGSITLIATMLLSADLEEDPMVEETKGLLDGHIVLSKLIADRGRYPAVDLLASLSRLAQRIQAKDVQRSIRNLRSVLLSVREQEKLIALGAHPLDDFSRMKAIREDLEKILDDPSLELDTREAAITRLGAEVSY